MSTNRRSLLGWLVGAAALGLAAAGRHLEARRSAAARRAAAARDVVAGDRIAPAGEHLEPGRPRIVPLRLDTIGPGSDLAG